MADCESKLPHDVVSWKSPDMITGQEKEAANVSGSNADSVSKVEIGLHQVLGHYNAPTRVVVTLKDGRQSSLPWEEAVKLLPPEFGDLSEVGSRARLLDRHVEVLSTVIRSNTDVMEKRGHAKDAVLKVVGRTRPALQWLIGLEVLAKDLDNLAQNSFLGLRSLAEKRESEVPSMAEAQIKIKALEDRLHEIAKGLFSSKPNAKRNYQQWIKEQGLTPIFEEGLY